MKKINIYLTITFITLLIILMGVLYRNKTILDENAERSLKENTEIPVYVTTPAYISTDSRMELTGKVISGKEISVIPKCQGIVIAKYRNAGDQLRKGETIARIEDDVIRQSLRLAELNLEKAGKDVARYTALLQEDVVTRTEMESIEMAFRAASNQVINLKEQVKNTEILSPANGILEKDYFEIGSLVSPAMAVAEVIDPGNLKVLATVTEKELIRISRGAIVTFTSDAYPADEFTGKVDIIGSRGDQTMSYYVEIIFSPDYSNKLKAGMHVRVSVGTEEAGRHQLAIERGCIVGSLKAPYVYVVNNNKAYRREISIGDVHADKVIIIEGLTPQDTIVRSGQINLKDATPVTIF